MAPEEKVAGSSLAIASTTSRRMGSSDEVIDAVKFTEARTSNCSQQTRFAPAASPLVAGNASRIPTWPEAAAEVFAKVNAPANESAVRNPLKRSNDGRNSTLKVI